MINAEQVKHYGDVAAIGGGGGISIAYLADIATAWTPIVTFLCAVLSLAWLAWRLIDRARYGPKRGGEDG